MTIPNEVAAVLSEMRELKVPNWPAGRILGDLADRIEAAMKSAEVCIVCDWQGDTARFVEAEIDGKSVILPWRDRADGLKELVIATTGQHPDVASVAAALRTMHQLGYTYHGGEYWKPPIGPRPESALTKADAVEPVEYQVRFRPVYVGAAEMSWSKCTREEYENPKLDSLYDKRALYAHSSPAVPVASVPDGWQPIETMPKDGSNFLQFSKRRGVTMNHWHTFTAIEGGSLNHVVFDDMPTHWKPLPTPPTNQEGAAP